MTPSDIAQLLGEVLASREHRFSVELTFPTFSEDGTAILRADKVSTGEHFLITVTKA